MTEISPLELRCPPRIKDITPQAVKSDVAGMARVSGGITYKFASAGEFEAVHVPGATIELENDLAKIRKFNNERKLWKGWVISPASKSSSTRGYLRQFILLTDVPDDGDPVFPKLGDPFQVHIMEDLSVNDEPINPGFLSAERIENPFDGICAPEIARLPAMRISMPAFMDGPREINLLAPFQHAQTIEAIQGLTLNDDKSVRIVLRLEENLTTYLAETGAFSWLSGPKREGRIDGPSGKSVTAFAHLLDFSQHASSAVNIFEVLRHMESPAAKRAIPILLRRQFAMFNKDHLAAYRGMANIPAGIHIVSGCPGAGKTHWNVTVGALAMSHPPRAGKNAVKILYLIDVNKPVDDVADRMAKLCRDANMKKHVIRMRGWPREMKFSSTLNSTQEEIEKLKQAGKKTGDFTPQFLIQAQLATSFSRCVKPKEMDKALSLDQAAWSLFERCTGRYRTLNALVKKLLQNGLQDPGQMKALRRHVYRLYRDVIRQADFIATTPVATWGEFAKLFKPDLIFIDEAPHARELTTLIPIAFFSPTAWILSGDHRQTRPFVASSTKSTQRGVVLKPNPFAAQMTISTMERAVAVGAVDNTLMINHRAYGNLQELSSDIFYDSKMSSGLVEAKRWPGPVRHLQLLLSKISVSRDVDVEPRALVQLRGSQELCQASSYLNPMHQKWVMAQVEVLLQDPSFVQVGKPKSAGRIIIMAPYRAAIMGYVGEVRRLPHAFSSRVDVRTIDTAQGHEADVVFLDLVRTTTAGFMDDPHRLNVAVTRARQAEVIVMNQGMLRRRDGRGGFVPTTHLRRMWRHCLDRNQIHLV